MLRNYQIKYLFIEDKTSLFDPCPLKKLTTRGNLWATNWIFFLHFCEFKNWNISSFSSCFFLFFRLLVSLNSVFDFFCSAGFVFASNFFLWVFFRFHRHFRSISEVQFFFFRMLKTLYLLFVLFDFFFLGFCSRLLGEYFASKPLGRMFFLLGCADPLFLSSSESQPPS